MKVNIQKLRTEPTSTRIISTGGSSDKPSPAPPYTGYTTDPTKEFPLYMVSTKELLGFYKQWRVSEKDSELPDWGHPVDFALPEIFTSARARVTYNRAIVKRIGGGSLQDPEVISFKILLRTDWDRIK